MPNYYEILKLQPDATAVEIEVALEGQYNQYRRLVTHHDPEIANKANQALLLLEKIRTTLTDPTSRATYDTGLAVTTSTGGLADPQVGSQAVRPTPPSPRPPIKPITDPTLTSTQRVDAWTCPKCRAPSPVGTRFCKQCGHTLSQGCPKCGKLIEKIATFCPACGVNVNKYIGKQKLLRLQLATEQAIYEAQEREREQRERRDRNYTIVAYITLIFLCFGGLFLLAVLNLFGS